MFYKKYSFLLFLIGLSLGFIPTNLHSRTIMSGYYHHVEYEPISSRTISNRIILHTQSYEYDSIEDAPRLQLAERTPETEEESEKIQTTSAFLTVFPNDVLAYMLTFFPTDDYVSMSKTCTDMYKFCFSERVLRGPLNRQMNRWDLEDGFSVIRFHHMALMLEGREDYIDPTHLNSVALSPEQPKVYAHKGAAEKFELNFMKKFHAKNEGYAHEVMVWHIDEWPKRRLGIFMWNHANLQLLYPIALKQLIHLARM